MPAHKSGCAVVHSVCTLEMRETVIQCAAERSDKWGLEVKGRMESCIDLVAEEAVYHHDCYFRFTQKRNTLREPKG